MPFSKNNKGTLRDNIVAGRYEFIPTSLWDKVCSLIVNFNSDKKKCIEFIHSSPQQKVL